MEFYTMGFNQFHTFIKILQTDNATEYLNRTISDFLKMKGIVHKTSCVSIPQQNGIAEHKYRHLLKVARALMLTTHMPTYF